MNLHEVIIILVFLVIGISIFLGVTSTEMPIYIIKNLYGTEKLPPLEEIDYYYKTVGFKINDPTPTLCFFEPDDGDVRDRFWKEDWLNLTAEAVGDWQWTLQSATGKAGWTWQFEYFPLHLHKDKYYSDRLFKNCDVMINFENMSEEYHLGQTAFHYKNSLNGYTLITVWANTQISSGTTIIIGETYADSQVIHTNRIIEIPTHNIKKIIQHEFGHALGLEHVYRTTNTNKLISIMQPHMDPTGENLDRVITQEDIDAVVLLYGDDGFGGWNNPLRERFIIIPWFS